MNLNTYRNTHFYSLNKSKIEFKKLVEEDVLKLPKLNKIRISYVLYAPDKRRRDISNVCSIIDKYFSDCLVELNKLTDDDYQHIPLIAYGWGGVDPIDPRVDIIIEEM